MWSFCHSALGTKLEQAKKFNDPNDPCKILVATDAIGMGLNLWVLWTGCSMTFWDLIPALVSSLVSG